MKKTYLIAALMVVGALVLLMSSSDELATYSDFAEADRKATSVKVVGQLSKDKDMVYNPQKDANRFTFFMKDENGIERQVVYLGEKPQDFELSEQIVVTGTMNKSDNTFVVNDEDMLLKCPSKYKDEEIELKKTAKS